MLWHAFQYAGQAGAADPLLAGHRDLDAVAFQDLDHGLVGRHLEDLATTADLDRKAAVVAAVQRRGGEVFAVQAVFLPALGPGAIQHVLHEAARPADIQMHVVFRRRQDLGGIQGGVRLLIEMQKYPVGEGRVTQALDKGRALAGAGAIMQLEVGAGMGQALGHAQDRGNSDTAGEQQAATCLVGQGEQVARFADAQVCATVDLFVQAPGAAPGRRVLEDADQVAMPFLGVIAQGILADQPVGQVHVDMRAGAEGRQWVAIDVGQFKAADVLGFVVTGYHHHIDHVQSSERCRRWRSLLVIR